MELTILENLASPLLSRRGKFAQPNLTNAPMEKYGISSYD